MRYLLLIYTPETMDQSSNEARARTVEYDRFTREVRDRGVLRAGEALQPTTTATTVRVRNEEALVTDGPFAETKEALGGFYLLDCRDLDEALELAARIPGARSGAIEVRPIFEQPAIETSETPASAAR